MVTTTRVAALHSSSSPTFCLLLYLSVASSCKRALERKCGNVLERGVARFEDFLGCRVSLESEMLSREVALAMCLDVRRDDCRRVVMIAPRARQHSRPRLGVLHSQSTHRELASASVTLDK